jgi:phi LC3 family holin
MKLNLKVRLKNPVFWLTIIPAITTFIYTVLSLIEVVPAISEDTLVNALSAIISALTTLGVLVDPTTVGVGDSERALTYDEPNS